ncbi:DNA repair protein [Agaricicola taiwanensis]|uniref:DNA repair protein n=1 Tax=Agaricicola taiwanensis TaxID=591372 RepID=A0A8J2VKU7_9RHOB|nr:Smr/MutS family protein [Agaricicola taiwanensis]GGE28882.1 DNA repair protein [Agaricicola taiwanensis]
MNRRKGLSREDLALWARIAETVQPLPGRKPILPPSAKEKVPPTSTADESKLPQRLNRVVPDPIPLQPLEHQLLKRLARGRTEIDARIDLHGLRQDEAHHRLRAFLAAEQGRGSRVVLVITGKGKSPATDDRPETGVLKRQVPHWLAAPDLRHTVLGFEEAARHHGGGGALYVRLRRSRHGMP